jgi:hypothetical protein
MLTTAKYVKKKKIAQAAIDKQTNVKVYCKSHTLLQKLSIFA